MSLSDRGVYPLTKIATAVGVVRDIVFLDSGVYRMDCGVVHLYTDLRGVVGREEVEILRERALMFLAAARDDLRAGRVAAFHAEQACRPALKYVLASRAGYYPHTRSLRRLFEEVRAVKPELWSLYERHRFAFEVMEDAYLGARCLPRRYSRDVVEHLVKVAEELVALCT